MTPPPVGEVPVIDLAPAHGGGRQARLEVARAIDAACREIGFFAIAGHGVPRAVVEDLRRHAHEFFALPLASKLASRHPTAGTNRGYHPVGGEALAEANDTAAPPDLKEFFHVGPVDVADDPYYTSPEGRQHFLPNIWPERPVGFPRAATTYYRAMADLIAGLMRLAALALDVDETFFDDKVHRSIGTMRLNYYPAQAAPPPPGQLRAGAHTDYGGFTILSGEDVPGGLQVRTRDGRWVDVATTPDRFVVNIGDLLMRWTNDRWLSNLHRVVNPPLAGGPGAARLSIAFFNHPNYDVLVESLASQGVPRHAPRAVRRLPGPEVREDQPGRRRRRRVTLREDHADLPGVRLWYADTGGAGTAVILMHAATGSCRVWEHQLPAFTAAGHRVIAYDRRGWGRSLIEPAGAQPGTAADDLHALLDHLGVDRCHLVGTAAGGIAALDFALSFPRRLRSLVVANSIGGVQDEEYLALGRRLRPPQFDALPPELRELGPSYRAAEPEGTRRWVELERVSRPDGPRAPAQGMRNRITFARLESLEMPVLLLTGGADLYAPPPVLAMFAARIAGAQSVIVPEAGHSAYWEAPDVFNRAVLDFLAGH